MKADIWSFRGQEVKDGLEIFAVTNEGSIVEEENVKEEVRVLIFDPKDQRVKDEGKEERSEGVSLLSARRRGKAVMAEEEVGCLSIANASPNRSLRTLAPNLGEHLFTTDSVEGIGEIHLKDPFLIDWECRGH